MVLLEQGVWIRLNQISLPASAILLGEVGHTLFEGFFP